MNSQSEKYLLRLLRRDLEQNIARAAARIQGSIVSEGSYPPISSPPAAGLMPNCLAGQQHLILHIRVK